MNVTPRFELLEEVYHRCNDKGLSFCIDYHESDGRWYFTTMPRPKEDVIAVKANDFNSLIEKVLHEL